MNKDTQQLKEAILNLYNAGIYDGKKQALEEELEFLMQLKDQDVGDESDLVNVRVWELKSKIKELK